MGTVRVTLDPTRPAQGRIDAARVDATTEADLRRQAAEDAAVSAPVGLSLTAGPSKAH